MKQIWLLVALVACKQSGSGSGGGGGGLGVTKDAPDYSSKKLVMAEGSIDNFAFSIKVPEGLPRNKKNTADWDDQGPEYEYAPKIFTSTIEIKRIQDLAQAKYNATLDAKAKTWVREQSRPTSWALTMAEPDKSRIEAITYVMANDDIFIKCKAVQYTATGTLPSYEKTKAMLEEICDSLKATGVAGDAKPVEAAEGAETAEPTEKAAEPSEPAAPSEPAPSEPAPSEGGGRLQKAAGE